MPRMHLFAAIFCAAALVLAPPALADHHEGEADQPKELKVGDKAPDFNLPKTDDENAPKKLSDYEGKKNVVLAFYPKAFTGGCTAQLCGYRDDFEKFTSTDTEVIAISNDEQDYSDEFKAEHKMPFTVLGDSTGDAIKKFGAARSEDNIMANRYIFVVDKEGAIAYIDREYNIGTDDEPLFAALKKLSESEKS